jgi:hypothetical protein
MNRPILICAAFALLLAGCAVSQQPVQFSPLTDVQQKSVASTVEVKLNTGYQRLVKAGSRWQRVGQIQQGLVYKPYQDVFTVEGKHIHEAWLVVRDERTLVGFYLPAEHTFSPLDPVVSISLN